MNIEIYSKEQCPYCDMAERIAQQFVQEAEGEYCRKAPKRRPEPGREQAVQKASTCRRF